MRLTNAQRIAILILILSFIIALLTNIATYNLPAWVQARTWLAWPLILCALIFLVIATLKEKSHEDTAEHLEPDQIDQYLHTVSDAEELVESDPGLQQTVNSSGKSEEWEILDLRLLRIIGANRQQGWKQNRDNEKIARLILRLTKVLIVTLPQYKRSRILNDLVVPTYKIALSLKAWHEAAFLAYEIATTFNDDGFPTKASTWAEYMRKNIEQIPGNNTMLDELHAKFYDITGITLKYHDIDIARKQLENALVYARKSSQPLLIWRVATHLGSLEKGVRARKFVRATELYEMALESIEIYESKLNNTDQAVNPDLKLTCYQALGELALLQGDSDQAHQWYTKQLALSANPRHTFYKGSAYKGLAEALLKKDPQNARQAYRMARIALDIEREIVGNREFALLKLLVQIADTWLQAAS